MKQTFTATVIPAGNATGVQVPAAVIEALQAGSRPQVVITINGHVWRSRVASKGGRFVIGISAANRAASKIALNDEVEVTLELDTQPREVTIPADLAQALDAHLTTRGAFEEAPLRSSPQACDRHRSLQEARDPRPTHRQTDQRAPQ